MQQTGILSPAFPINPISLMLTFDNQIPPNTLDCAAYKHGRRTRSIDIDEISDVLAEDDTFVWVAVFEPDLELMAKLQEEFGLHQLAIDDALAAHQRPKLEEYGDILFIVLHTAARTNNKLQIGETHLFLGPRFLVAVRHGPSFGYDKVRERFEAIPDQLAKGPGFALYAVMDYVVDNYRPIMDALEAHFQQLERDLFSMQFSRDCLEELYSLRRQLLSLRSIALPLIDICNALIRFHTEIIPKESRIYFRDINDHVIRIAESSANTSDMVTAAMQVNLSLVTVGQNEIVKKLAGWGAILAIPTMVFSLYGMNFRHMPELDWEWAYPAVLAGVGLASLWLYRKLKKADWL